LGRHHRLQSHGRQDPDHPRHGERIYTDGSQSAYALAQTAANSYFAGYTGTDVVAEQVGSDTYVFFDLTNTNLASMVVQMTRVTASTLILADFI
jgi:hypothetical protein